MVGVADFVVKAERRVDPVVVLDVDPVEPRFPAVFGKCQIMIIPSTEEDGQSSSNLDTEASRERNNC